MRRPAVQHNSQMSDLQVRLGGVVVETEAAPADPDEPDPSLPLNEAPERPARAAPHFPNARTTGHSGGFSQEYPDPLAQDAPARLELPAAHRAGAGRDEEAIRYWKRVRWPQLKKKRAASGAPSSSSTRAG